MAQAPSINPHLAAPVLGRPSARKDALVTQLRHKILEGELAPGARLPSRLEMIERFGASPVTVQRALDRLVEDGFVRVQGRQGTFVSENPPHLSRYALVFPAHPFQSDQWRNFWTSLSNEAFEMTARQNSELPIYHGVLGHTDFPEYLRLVKEVKAHRVAGLIFATHPQTFLDTPLFENPHLPRVAITGRTDLPGVHALHMDSHAFIDKSLDYFQAKGRKRVASLGHAGTLGDMEKYFLQSLQKRGLETRPYWMQTVELATPEAARAASHLLAHSRKAEPFDAFLIFDDHLVEQSLTGLIEAGARVPDEIEVVAHGNFPLLVHGLLPARRLGFDAAEVMRACVEIIDRKRQGEDVPMRTHIAPVWEDELPKR